MSHGAFLLDTSIAIDLSRHDSTARRHLAQADEVFLEVVAIGELFLGAELSPRRDDEFRAVESLVGSTRFLPADRLAAETYARLKHDLRRRGTPIPDNDLWIAATAVRHGLTLATRDRHFAVVSGLRTDRWE